MPSPYNVLILGASYGSLLGMKMALAGHSVKLVCLPEEAELINNDGQTVRMPIGDFKLRTTEFRDGANPDIRIFAGYFFVANGQITPNPEGVRAFAFNLKTKYAYYAKIQFTMRVSEGTTREEFSEVVADLAGEILPELMLCLPDWSEVEAESADIEA